VQGCFCLKHSRKQSIHFLLSIDSLFNPIPHLLYTDSIKSLLQSGSHAELFNLSKSFHGLSGCTDLPRHVKTDQGMDPKGKIEALNLPD
jgi:hypothetical protein